MTPSQSKTGQETLCRVIVAGETIEEIESFDYSDDVLTIAEEAHFSVVSKDRKYRDKLKIGDKIEFILQNPAVNGGAHTVRHRGRIVARTPRYSQQEGSIIQCVSANAGWHLQTSDAPLWISLANKSYRDLCDPATSPFFDASWGFSGVRFDGKIRRALKQGRAILVSEASEPLPLLHAIQVEPGVKVADKLVEYCRRVNLLVNVAPDNSLCCFLPDYKQEPLFSIRNRAGDPLNNVLSCEGPVENAATRWTQVDVVGEQIAWEGETGSSQENPNATKKRGTVRHPDILPFANRHTVADGQMYSQFLAARHAEWVYKRGRFDSWYVKYTVPGHHQGGNWWVADSMCSVEDQENNLSGLFYVQSVRFPSHREGDVTEVIIREPGLLSASLGVIPDPSLTKSSMSGKPVAVQ